MMIDAVSPIKIMVKPYKKDRIYIGFFALGDQRRKLASFDSSTEDCEKLLQCLNIGKTFFFADPSEEVNIFFFIPSEHGISIAWGDSPFAFLNVEESGSFKDAVQKVIREVGA